MLAGLPRGRERLAGRGDELAREIGSVAGITGNFGTGYSASKWALEGLSRSAAYIYADWGIRCNVIQPGWIETDLTASMTSNP